MRYAVFGVGRQGAAVVYDLFERCEASQIVAFDLADGIRERLREVLGASADRVAVHALDPDDELNHHKIVDLIRPCVCVISALPYALNPIITRLCQDARVPMCDLGGNPDVVAEQSRIADESTLIVPDCGLSPGLNNVFSVHLRKAHGVTSARAYCGGIPARRPADNPLSYKLLFSAWGLISEYSGKCAVLRNGRLEYVEALTGLEELPNDREAFYTSNNSPLVFENLLDIGLRDYEYKTVRWRGHLERVLLLKQLGFFRGNRKLDAALAEGLSQADWLRFDRRRDVDEAYLRVEGRTDAGQTHAVGITVQGNESFSAMELTTSWGATIPAYWIARGAAQVGAALPAGCLPPERVVDTTWALRELARRTAVKQE